MAVERRGEMCAGLAAGIDRRHLQRLKRGEPEAEYEIDLHGRTRSEARGDVAGAIDEARGAGARCLLVIHGRGAGSAGSAVLKEALVGWLSSPPLAGRVMAFASALPEDGGPGATYVLLRRIRS